jgi:hypothetical protein
MKNLIITLLIAISLGFTSCGEDAETTPKVDTSLQDNLLGQWNHKKTTYQGKDYFNCQEFKETGKDFGVLNFKFSKKNDIFDYTDYTLDLNNVCENKIAQDHGLTFFPDGRFISHITNITVRYTEFKIISYDFNSIPKKMVIEFIYFGSPKTPLAAKYYLEK